VSNRVKQRRRAYDIMVTALFLGAIAATTVDLLVRDDEARGPAPEFRTAAPKPGFPRDAKAFYKFPAEYEAHFADTFGLRDKLLRANSIEKLLWSGLSPTNSQIVGDDGWIFYAGDRSMEIIRGVKPLSNEALAAWQREFDERARMHAAGGRRYLFVLVPNKETIYPERLPDSIRPTGPTRMDQLLAWMREYGRADLLDMRPAFLAAKKDDTGPLDPLYTPYGTHWTSRGVYTAYAAIVGHLAQGTNFRGPLPFSDFQLVRYAEGADSFASNLYLSGLLVQPGDALFRVQPNTLSVIEHKLSPPRRFRTRSLEANLLPAAVVFHDSFGPFISVTLAQSFQSLDMCEGVYDRSRIDPRETKIVVEMFVERYLFRHPPRPTTEPPLDPVGGGIHGLAHTLFDLAATPDAARAVEGLGLTRTESGGLRLERKSAKDGLVLGPFRSPKTGVVRMFFVLEAAEKGSLDVMWRRVGTESFNRLARTQVMIGPRREARDVDLPALGGEVEIMLRPTSMQPAIIVHECTVEAAEAP